MNVPLLLRLRAADGAFVPIEELGETVQDDLDDLQKRGFALERHPYLGVAYRGPSMRLCPDQIEWELPSRYIGRKVAVWHRVGSTNDVAAASARSRANAGLVVLAEEQTTGRGRRGRAWVAPPGTGLLMSILVFPEPSIASVPWITALGAVATAQVVMEVTGRPARIKWPNDVRVDGRKIAGILVERGRGVVIGIGLNVSFDHAMLPDELRDTATSLTILTGQACDRSEIARRLILTLDRLYAQGVAEGQAPLGALWTGLLEPIGRTIRVATRTEEIEGRLERADLHLGLYLEFASGESRWIPHTEIQSLDGEVQASPTP